MRGDERRAIKHPASQPSSFSFSFIIRIRRGRNLVFEPERAIIPSVVSLFSHPLFTPKTIKIETLEIHTSFNFQKTPWDQAQSKEKENKVKQNRIYALLKNLHESTEKRNERILVDQKSLLSPKGFKKKQLKKRNAILRLIKNDTEKVKNKNKQKIQKQNKTKQNKNKTGVIHRSLKNVSLR